MVGTDIQEVFDSFFIKLPHVDFQGKEDMVIKFFKIAVGKSKKTVSYDLSYTIDMEECDGYFNNVLEDENIIELIAMYMVELYYIRQFTFYSQVKQHVGTVNFNKLPESSNKNLQSAIDGMKQWQITIEDFRQEFYTYEDE